MIDEKLQHEVDTNVYEENLLGELNWACKTSHNFQDFMDEHEAIIYEYYLFQGNDPKGLVSEFEAFAKEVWDEFVYSTIPF